MNPIPTPSPHFNERPAPIDAIIIHYTDMVSTAAALAWLTNPSSKVSAHYLISEKGLIYQMVSEEMRAWHAGESTWQGRSNVNDYSIGIELANPGHSHGYQPFPEAQIHALIKLCLEIKARWDIPAHRILGHSDVAPQRKQDPGHLFPWQRLAGEGLGMWPKKIENLKDPSPAHSLCEFTTSPTRGEVIHTGTKPSPLVGEGGPQGRVRGTILLDASLEILSHLGYDISSPSHALLAFQRHFQPHKVDGITDQETYALLQGLLNT